MFIALTLAFRYLRSRVAAQQEQGKPMDLIDNPRDGENAPEFSVSEISSALRKVIEGEFGRVRIRGEVGRVFPARSGHLYFDIKDDRNVLACVTWKGQLGRLTARPEEGMEVVATGKLTTFGSQSKYQLNVEDIAPAGEGALMAMLEKRKKQLASEGLFEESRKKKLPLLPGVIGVVTSPSGAVIRDILHRLRERFPREVVVWPVAVQGRECAPQVSAAIAGFNRLPAGGAVPRPDLIIVARGGGSIEDLWGFNEETVARAVAASEIPVISAVGHETDTTLIDYVSDRRAPTPTAAAEIAVPVRLELQAWMDSTGARMTRALSVAVERRSQRLRDLQRAMPRSGPLLAGRQQRVDVADARLPGLVERAVADKRSRLAAAERLLHPGLLTARVRDASLRMSHLSSSVQVALGHSLQGCRQRLNRCGDRLHPRSARQVVTQGRGRLAELDARFQVVGPRAVRRLQQQLASTDRLRESLGYQRTLERGFAVVRADDKVITTASEGATKPQIDIVFADGTLKVRPQGSKTADGSKKSKPTPPEQGSLF